MYFKIKKILAAPTSKIFIDVMNSFFSDCFGPIDKPIGHATGTGAIKQSLLNHFNSTPNDQSLLIRNLSRLSSLVDVYPIKAGMRPAVVRWINDMHTLDLKNQKETLKQFLIKLHALEPIDTPKKRNLLPLALLVIQSNLDTPVTELTNCIQHICHCFGDIADTLIDIQTMPIHYEKLNLYLKLNKHTPRIAYFFMPLNNFRNIETNHNNEFEFRHKGIVKKAYIIGQKKEHSKLKHLLLFGNNMKPIIDDFEKLPKGIKNIIHPFFLREIEVEPNPTHTPSIRQLMDIITSLFEEKKDTRPDNLDETPQIVDLFIATNPDLDLGRDELIDLITDIYHPIDTINKETINPLAVELAIIRHGIASVTGLYLNTEQLLAVSMAIWGVKNDKHETNLMINTGEGKTMVNLAIAIHQLLKGEKVALTTHGANQSDIDHQFMRPVLDLFGFPVWVLKEPKPKGFQAVYIGQYVEFSWSVLKSISQHNQLHIKDIQDLIFIADERDSQENTIGSISYSSTNKDYHTAKENIAIISGQTVEFITDKRIHFFTALFRPSQDTPTEEKTARIESITSELRQRLELKRTPIIHSDFITQTEYLSGILFLVLHAYIHLKKEINFDIIENEIIPIVPLTGEFGWGRKYSIVTEAALRKIHKLPQQEYHHKLTLCVDTILKNGKKVIATSATRHPNSKNESVFNITIPPHTPTKVTHTAPRYLPATTHTHTPRILWKTILPITLNGPAMIFFKTVKEAREFYRFLKNSSVHKRILFIGDTKTTDMSVLDNLGPHDVVISTQFGGRGISITPLKPLSVILTFVPKNKNLLKQIFGRTARFGQLGSTYFFIPETQKQILKTQNATHIQYPKEDLEVFDKKITQLFDPVLLDFQELAQKCEGLFQNPPFNLDLHDIRTLKFHYLHKLLPLISEWELLTSTQLHTSSPQEINEVIIAEKTTRLTTKIKHLNTQFFIDLWMQAKGD